MTHNLHILLGNYAEQNIYRIKEYVNKYGKEYVDKKGRTADHYLQLMLYDDAGQFHLAKHKQVDDAVFISGIDNLFATELVPIDDAMLGKGAMKKLIHFFRERFTSTVNMDDRGDDCLHVCIHVPLYHDEAWANAEILIAAIEETGANYTVDLLLVDSDLAFLTIDDSNILAAKAEELAECAKRNLTNIIEAKTSMKYSVLKSLILLQNHNANGIALNLNINSYANIVGEYALVVTTEYNQIFNTSFLISTKQDRPVLGIGLSMLNFDRYYFVQYLLRKAYNYILDRENVMQKKVDVNKVSKVAHEALLNNVNIFTNLYDKYVKSMIYERQMSHDDIMAEIDPLIREAIENVSTECTSYIYDDKLTLPEKRATLAQLLGKDDPLLQGIQFNADQLVVDECRNDVMAFFVDANNTLAKMPEDVVDDQGTPIRDYAAISTTKGEPIRPVIDRVNHIKNLKRKIKTSADYIRRSTEELALLYANLQIDEDSHKRITPEGFQYGDKVYRLNPKNIERPLEETYVPVSTAIPSEADLRRDFTSIKDQGRLGSCTAFAMVAAYEYIIKRDQRRELDLSELFAYQNARKRLPEDQKEEEGTSIYGMVKGMGEDGICLEELHPYRVEDPPEPSEEAKVDAQTRKITKALNVSCNLHDFKSVISQGYPIVISLRLFESFAQCSGTGFVPRPTNDERKLDEHSNHAMVVCGYSDKEKVFIVRNSWGTHFGDKGYCYIPYSYITDPELMNQACIITEISEVEVKVMDKVSTITVAFNLQDTIVQAAIKRTLIEEERVYLEKLNAELSSYATDYYQLVSAVGRPNNRESLCVGTERRLKWEVEQHQEKQQAMTMERIDRLDQFDSDSRKLWIMSGVCIAGVIIIYSVLTALFNGFLFSFWITGITLLGIISLVVTPGLFKRTREFVIEDNKGSYDGNVTTIWIGSAVIGIVALLIAIFFLGYFNWVASWYSHNLFTTFVLSLLLFIPFESVFICRRGIREALDAKYESDIQSIGLEIAELEDMQSVIRLKTHIAGTILDSITELISDLTNKYTSMREYVVHLSNWRNETDSEMDTQPINRQPFMSLISNDRLNEYFDIHADELTADIRLYNLLSNNLHISDAQIIAFKNDIKKGIATKLRDSVANFSIFDYVVGNRTFDYIDGSYTSLKDLITTMDANSTIFVRTTMRMSTVSSSSVCCKMLYRSAPTANDSCNWDKSVENMFSKNPTMHDLSTDKKIFIIRLEGLSPSEIMSLQ